MMLPYHLGASQKFCFTTEATCRRTAKDFLTSGIASPSSIPFTSSVELQLPTRKFESTNPSTYSACRRSTDSYCHQLSNVQSNHQNHTDSYCHQLSLPNRNPNADSLTKCFFDKYEASRRSPMSLHMYKYKSTRYSSEFSFLKREPLFGGKTSTGLEAQFIRPMQTMGWS
ncbi:hypothetical protein RHMOL_Rhmol04G0217300 [Rhododendron molle]|uniref:Uncharacterized protein n=1 Tax=Rhododendron molle TaxID=49168 RepID=A0ACC0P381_RHOML|nr:hypothetical protein RHMOL_Rhmol04G0217300 [Rhododendron molle]